MTLAAQITADVVPLFLNTSEFADANVVQYPLGNQAAPLAVAGAIVDLWEQGSHPVTTRDGSQFVRGLRLTLPSAIAVNVDQREESRDLFLARGILWRAERVESIEGGLQTVFCRRIQSASTKKTRNPY